ncbi:MAG: ribonuclease G [Betaproteobacteria bacterium]|nr:ribonuclease G [Betaproteobacteria bacterium]NBO43445.1 ribonuclease G [Betaproteobacteria bacterium]NBQ08400.1 ribonuclease G [Betaproteobacteria bacterium]NBQ81522.1 ribonuclease G [Betaproteobacteria bacterium]NBU00850.1 ribonuclease G [Betaproteobacteria bacterium]
MLEELLIQACGYETRVALVRQGMVQEVLIERAATRGLVGNIYLGKVNRVLPGMQSAFIDIGLERAAFLHVADLWQARQLGARQEQRDEQRLSAIHIEKTLFVGQPLLVQVIKDPLGTKGARLSTQISIAGRLLVYLPQSKHIGISSRIDQENEREGLRQRLQSLIPDEERGGFIVRTSAELAEDAALAIDIAYLRQRWQEILRLSQQLPASSLLYQELSLSERCLRDMVAEATASVRVDQASELEHLIRFARAYMPAVEAKIRMYRGDRPIFDLYGIEAEIERALARRVDLKSGGYLIIDQTEALTTIDINTGGYVGGKNFDDTVFKTNMEAAHTIARQLRLRNLGGIIVIDFIDMQHQHHREAVLQELRKALAADRTRSSVLGFTGLGLVEMTRKRTRESLAHVLREACPLCEGKGEVKTARSICYEILREIRREAGQFDPQGFRIIASPLVIDLFLDEESASLASLTEDIGKPLSLAVEASYSQEQYDIVLN